MKLANINSIKGLACPQQYAQLDGLKGFFIILKQRIYKNLEQRLKLLEQISWQYKGDNTYLAYYYDNMYGFPRSFGEVIIQNLYDNGQNYDSSLRYDEANFVGLLDLRLYKILIKWLLSYGEVSYTNAWLCGLIQDFCNVDSQAYTITKDGSGITITIKRSTRSVLLQRIMNNTNLYDCLPIEQITFKLN